MTQFRVIISNSHCIFRKCACCQNSDIWFFPDNKKICWSFINALKGQKSNHSDRKGFPARCECRRCFDQFGRLNLEEYNCTSSSMMSLIRELSRARKTIDISMYMITNNILIEVLIHMRKYYNVLIRVVVEACPRNDESTDDRMSSLKSAGIKVKQKNIGADNLPAYRSIMHNKCVLIDRQVLLTGSFNWTRNAVLVNDENIIKVGSRQIIIQWIKKYEAMWREIENPPLAG